MTDIVDPVTRSRIMSSIRSKDTKPELFVRRYIHSRGLRFRLKKRKDMPFKPDLVMSKWNLVIFVHGCFWHRHRNCSYATTPSNRRDHWNEKFSRNIDRDHLQYRWLRDNGWRVLVIWECGLKMTQDRIAEIIPLIKGGSVFSEWPSLPPKPSS